MNKKFYIFGILFISVIIIISAIQWDVSTATYDNKRFNTTTQTEGERGIFFNSTGKGFYAIGLTGDDVLYQYTMTVPWDISTATYGGREQNINGVTNTTQGIFFKTDGTKFYAISSSDSTIRQFSLSSAWMVGTLTYDNKKYGSSQNRGIAFNSSGTGLYAVSGNNVSYHTLTTAWDVSTASYNGKSKATTCTDNTAEAVFFRDSGTKMYVLCSSNNFIQEYKLTTAWDISTATNLNSNLNVGGQTTSEIDLFINNSGNKLYVYAEGGVLYQYNMALNIAPTITINYPANNKISTSTTNTFSLTCSDAEDLDYCVLYGNWSSQGWHVNRTNSNPTNGSQTNFTNIYVPQGKYLWSGWVNDSEGVSVLGANRTLFIDASKPNVTNVSITTSLGSRTFEINSTQDDNFYLDKCWYRTVKTSNGVVDIGNTTFTCNTQPSDPTASEFTTYDLTIYVNDTAGNQNSTTKSFTLSQSSSGDTGGGGGGGGSVSVGGVLLTQAQNFTITTTNLGELMDISLAKESTKPRTKEFILRNIGLEPIELTVICDTQSANESSQGIDICDYVELPEGPFLISPNLEDPLVLKFKVQTPKNANIDDEYFFNLIAINSQESKFDKLSVRTRVSFFALLLKWSYFPFQEDKPDLEKINYPIGLVSVVFSIFLFLGSLFLFSRLKLEGLGFLFSTLIFFLSFILFLIIL